LNNKNNTFRDATKEYGLGELYSFSTGANFGDVNADGYPDLYVGNYFTQYPGDLSTINASMIVGANQIGEGNLLINQQGKVLKMNTKTTDFRIKALVLEVFLPIMTTMAIKT
jgi:hypothetical protein